MKSAWRIGRIAGIDIYIDSSWLLIFVLFTWSLAANFFPRSYPGWATSLYWVLGAATSLLVFASVLVHELAHSLVAQRQGEKVARITLFILGGVAQITEEPKEPLQEFAMAFVGPLTSFGLAGVFFLVSFFLAPLSRPLQAAAFSLAFINGGLGVFNLLPGFPLDGGRVLRSILWKATGSLKKATRVASAVGQGFAFLFIFFGILRILRGDIGGLWPILIGWFLHNAAVRSYEQVMVRTALQGLTAADLMTRDFETVPEGLSVQTLVDEYILKRKERVFLVTGDGGLRGIICLEDVKAQPRSLWPKTSVGEIMTPRDKLVAVTPDADGSRVLASLASRDVHQVPVLDGDRVAGIICRTDMLKVLQLRSDLGV
ncbi:MAG: site-2 protease family protein [Candidatus Aminicenantes bacterium]|nr:site-2 protease family protein [Candidatus Aminicenantes bacterium]